MVDSGNWESQSKTPPQSPEDVHIYCILLIRIAFCHCLKTCHFAACFTILWTFISAFYVNTARDVVTVWMKIAFIITRKRNNVVVSFGTLKVQSFMLTEVRDWFADCRHIFYFSQKKRRIKRKKAVSPDHQSPQSSIYIDKCTVYTYTVYMYIAL